MIIPYELIGKLVIYLILASFMFAAAGLLMGGYIIIKKRIILPQLVLMLLDFFHSPAKMITRLAGLRESLVDEIIIEVSNAVNRKRYRKVKKKKVLIGPQCLRHPKCPARSDVKWGYVCQRCGRCVYTRIGKAADKHGFRLFIVPGDSLAKKIITRYGARTAIGIACYKELSEALRIISRSIPGQGVPLLKDGCYRTKVDVNRVIDTMKMSS